MQYNILVPLRHLILVLYIGCLLSIGVTNAAHLNLNDADMAYDKGEFMQAIDMYKPLAEQGNAAAQNNLGVMYDQGRGITKDYQEALKWYRLSAAQENAEA